MQIKERFKVRGKTIEVTLDGCKDGSGALITSDKLSKIVEEVTKDIDLNEIDIEMAVWDELNLFFKHGPITLKALRIL